MQVTDQRAQGLGIAGIDCRGDARDKVLANGAFLVAERRLAGWMVKHAKSAAR